MNRNATLAPILIAAVAASACGGGARNAAPAANPTPAAPAPTEAAPAPPAEAPAAPARPAPEAALPDLPFPQDEYRKTQPAATAPRPLQLPQVQRFKLPSGVEAFLVEDHRLPTLTMQLSFEGGAIDDPPGKEGLSGICAATMGDSTEALDKVQLAEALADMASAVNVFASDDQLGVAARTLTRSLEPTAALFADVLLRPGFRQADLDRNVKLAKADLRQRKGSAGGIASLLSGSIFYGENHPLGRFPTDASLSAVTLEDCKAWSKDWFKPQGAKLWLAGDVTPAQVKELSARIFKDWKGKPKATAKVGKPTPRKGRIFFVDVPGATQSVVQVVFPGPERKAKDYFASTIVSNVLGGGFSSRINMNIREDKGYAYGARGTFGYTRYFGTFNASGQIRTDVTDKAIIEILKEISKMATGDLTDAEVTREKSSIVQSLPAIFETSGRILDAYKNLVYFGLPLDYYARLTRNVTAVDTKIAARAAKDHIKPKDVIVFVVGDASVVLPGLQKLHADKAVGDGDLVILDVDGKVVGNR